MAEKRKKSGAYRREKKQKKHLTFLSNDTQNKIVLIISQLITEKIVKALQECRAWALIVDTTADIAHQEQLSLCVRIVHSTLNTFWHVKEHLELQRKIYSVSF